jgi:hypothetical protein
MFEEEAPTVEYLEQDCSQSPEEISRIRILQRCTNEQLAHMYDSETLIDAQDYIRERLGI